MATDAASHSTPSISNLSPFNQSNHIDLTLDDDDPRHSTAGTQATSLRRADSAALPPRQTTFFDPIRSAVQQQYHQPMSFHTPKFPVSPSISHPSQELSQSFSPGHPSTPFRQGFASPSVSHFCSPHTLRSQGPPPSYFSPPTPRTLPNNNNVPARPSSSAQPNDHVIDLTTSPSPPLSPRPHHSPLCVALSDDLPPKTPVCIGQLTVTALVLYPVPYIQLQDPVRLEDDWASVRLQYEHNPQKAPTSETIHIKTPHIKGSSEAPQGEVFGVVEQRVASHLGPMLGKGLIRLDAKVRRDQGNPPILPLQMLVYTPKGNITVVGNYLYQCGLYLDHPSDFHKLANCHYYNPHNPPPGGFRQASASGRVPYAGPGGSSSRWGTPAVSGKTLEIQRSQVDELFKSLKSGDELAETEPAFEVGTPLYPHQKKALTFLLEREHERRCSDGRYSSMWQPRFDPHTRQQRWLHIVTQKEVFQEPAEARGAILADDMGLGKTITCVSLIAATLDSADAFASSPLEVPPPPPERNRSEDIVSAAHFSGSVWGMPDVTETITLSSSKGKAKAVKEQDKAEAEYARACRIKAKSRATLIICPLSTVSNWEDQFREHWRGEVFRFGEFDTACSQTPSAQPEMTGSVTRPSKREGRPLRVYIYHGNARRPDIAFLADFDAVITTYATLASEYSRQNRKIVPTEGDADDDGSSDGGFGGNDTDSGVARTKPKRAGMKRKKSCFTLGGLTEATSPLQMIHWFRVVLDEAHCIKETATVGSRASCDLTAHRRLFLALRPARRQECLDEYIGTPVKYGQSLGVVRLQTVMKCITLRRTKDSKASDGKRILSLPPRRDELRYLKFEPHEQVVYDQFFRESKAEFNELSSKNEVMKNYVGILQKILRLRQICDHFELVEGKGLGEVLSADSGNYEDIVAAIERDGLNSHHAAAIVMLLREAGTSQCVECGEELCTNGEREQMIDGGMGMDVDGPSAPKRGKKGRGVLSRAPTRPSSPSTFYLVLTRCLHLFCLPCFRQCTWPGWPDVPSDACQVCSACQTGLSPQDAIQVRPDCSPQEPSPRKKTVKREKRLKGVGIEKFQPSTKVKALLGDLVQFSKMNPYSTNYDPESIEVQMVDGDGRHVDDHVIKTVVFSQWTSMLDKVEDALEAAGIRYDRLDGTMKRDERTRAMDALKYDTACEVLLVSLKAGGVGLNLTAAQRVYLMDPYWNPAVENQAVDRIHRLGQTRPVTTVKLIIENSIEDRLLEVQRKKTELANMTLGQNISKAELLHRRMEELQQLFGT
ncbi:P-loop containing nucleoside triphosphate hydrolase protein [Pisolithus thermaeus]|nr:P-loop containing nucleoside triphosphate hydrolase protein [Pisolithus thermaeus]